MGRAGARAEGLGGAAAQRRMPNLHEPRRRGDRAAVRVDRAARFVAVRVAPPRLGARQHGAAPAGAAGRRTGVRARSRVSQPARGEAANDDRSRVRRVRERGQATSRSGAEEVCAPSAALSEEGEARHTRVGLARYTSDEEGTQAIDSEEGGAEPDESRRVPDPSPMTLRAPRRDKWFTRAEVRHRFLIQTAQ